MQHKINFINQNWYYYVWNLQYIAMLLLQLHYSYLLCEQQTIMGIINDNFNESVRLTTSTRMESGSNTLKNLITFAMMHTSESVLKKFILFIWKLCGCSMKSDRHEKCKNRPKKICKGN